MKEMIRAIGLPGVADNMKFFLNHASNFRANYRFKRENSHLRLPPPYLCHDAYNTTNLAYYYKSGYEHAKYISGLIKKHADGDLNELNILDFGCGLCRLLRHFAELLPGATVSGSDYNPRTIEWARSNLKGPRFSQNDLIPPSVFRMKNLMLFI